MVILRKPGPNPPLNTKPPPLFHITVWKSSTSWTRFKTASSACPSSVATPCSPTSRWRPYDSSGSAPSTCQSTRDSSQRCQTRALGAVPYQPPKKTTIIRVVLRCRREFVATVFGSGVGFRSSSSCRASSTPQNSTFERGVSPFYSTLSKTTVPTSKPIGGWIYSGCFSVSLTSLKTTLTRAVTRSGWTPRATTPSTP